MRYVDANIFIANLTGDNRLAEAARKYLEAVASGKELGCDIGQYAI